MASWQPHHSALEQSRMSQGCRLPQMPTLGTSSGLSASGSVSCSSIQFNACSNELVPVKCSALVAL